MMVLSSAPSQKAPSSRSSVSFWSLKLSSPLLGKAEQEHGPIALLAANQHPIAAASSLVLPRYPLLDEPAAEVGIDQPAFSPIDRIPESGVRNPLASCEARRPSRFEKLQSLTIELVFL